MSLTLPDEMQKQVRIAMLGFGKTMREHLAKNLKNAKKKLRYIGKSENIKHGLKNMAGFIKAKK